MKKILIALSITCSLFSFSQSPQGINYQAVIRNTTGTIVSISTVSLKFRIVQGSETGNAVFKEKFTALTTNLSLVNVVLGQGTPLTGIFNTIHLLHQVAEAILTRSFKQQMNFNNLN
jgi:hypothetical protein